MTPTALLTLMQWLSPGFPVGAFAYSHGLEALVVQGRITDAGGFERWLHAVLDHGAGRGDLILLAQAYRGDVEAADVLARALAPTSERLLETVQQGTGFAATANAIWGLNLAPLTLPVAVGAAAAAQDIPLRSTAQAFIHAFAAAMTSAATRAIPLGQTEAQMVLARTASHCLRIADEALQASLDEISSTVFLADIASMQHEVQYSRMFRS